MIAFYVYDRALLLDREIELIWQHRKLSVATGLYYVLQVSTGGYIGGFLAASMVRDCEVVHIL